MAFNLAYTKTSRMPRLSRFLHTNRADKSKHLMPRIILSFLQSFPPTENHLTPSKLPPLSQCLAIIRKFCAFHPRPVHRLTAQKQRSRNVPQATRHRHRSPVRQVRRQMPRLRQLRAPHDPRPHLRRMLLWQLPEQVRGMRRRGKLPLLPISLHAGGEGKQRG